MDLDLAIRAKRGDRDSIIALHRWYLDVARTYYDQIQNTLTEEDKNIILTTFDHVKVNDYVSYLNLFLNIIKHVCPERTYIQNSDLEYIYEHTNNIILLPNYHGHFDFRSYLKVHYAGYELVGIPIVKSKFDNMLGCPIDFVLHDASHMRYVFGNRMSSDYVYHIYVKYKDVVDVWSDFLMMMIWLYIHENGLKESFYRKQHPLARKNRLSSLRLAIQSELTQYIRLLTTDNNIKSTFDAFIQYKDQNYLKEYYVLKKYELTKDLDLLSDEVIFLLAICLAYDVLIVNDKPQRFS